MKKINIPKICALLFIVSLITSVISIILGIANKEFKLNLEKIAMINFLNSYLPIILPFLLVIPVVVALIWHIIETNKNKENN